MTDVHATRSPLTVAPSSLTARFRDDDIAGRGKYHRLDLEKGVTSPMSALPRTDLDDTESAGLSALETGRRVLRIEAGALDAIAEALDETFADAVYRIATASKGA